MPPSYQGGLAVAAELLRRELAPTNAVAPASRDHIARHASVCSVSLHTLAADEQQHSGPRRGNTPVDDEPTTPEKEGGLREAREQIARGEVISADEICREFA
jgi:hypothetical protein